MKSLNKPAATVRPSVFNMKCWLSTVCTTALVVCSIVFAPAAAHAQFGETINDFTADYTLSKDDKQGSLHVVESIDITFQGEKHGILRAIPQRYKGHSLQLKVRHISSGTGAPTKYSSYTQHGNTVLKIGDANRTISGRHTYTITYDLNNVMTFYDDHDEFYWNINGAQWTQPFAAVRMRLHLPSGLTLSSDTPLCFTGEQGSAEQDCTISTKPDSSNTMTAETTDSLYAYENMSVVIGFQKGFFQPSTLRDTLMETLPTVIKILAPIVLFGGYAIRRWRTYGRDAAGRGTIVPQYDPPKGLTPVEVGTLLHFSTNQKHITATIIDLAIRGYLVIHEEKIDRKVLKDKLEYSLELKLTTKEELKDFEIKTLSGLFQGTAYEAGSIVKLTDLKNKFYTSVSVISSQVKKSLVKGGYFAGDPAAAGGRLWVLVALLFISCFFAGALFGPALVVGIVISMIIVIVCAFAMSARTALGTEALEHAKGLKLYLSLAEADRIKMLQSPDAPYAANSMSPKHPV